MESFRALHICASYLNFLQESSGQKYSSGPMWLECPHAWVSTGKHNFKCTEEFQLRLGILTRPYAYQIQLSDFNFISTQSFLFFWNPGSLEGTLFFHEDAILKDDQLAVKNDNVKKYICQKIKYAGSFAKVSDIVLKKAVLWVQKIEFNDVFYKLKDKVSRHSSRKIIFLIVGSLHEPWLVKGSEKNGRDPLV